MKIKWVSYFAFLLLVITCFFSFKNEEASVRSEDTPPIYFSLEGSCNFKLSMGEYPSGIILINDKEMKGIVKKNPYNEGFYDFIVHGNPVITFNYEDTDVIVENQKYQHRCTSAKYIKLNKLNGDENAVQLLQKAIADDEGYFDDINAINDKAFYLERLNYNKAAYFLLKIILLKAPDRAVAWLNMGDVCWSLDHTSEAQKSYEQYISLMKSQGKEISKIPKRVYERQAIK